MRYVIVEEEPMPAIASLEDLNAVNEELAALRDKHPAAYAELASLFRRHRGVGYRNICKLLLEEASPEELKGLK
jgi:hypothetical protein